MHRSIAVSNLHKIHGSAAEASLALRHLPPTSGPRMGDASNQTYCLGAEPGSAHGHSGVVNVGSPMGILMYIQSTPALGRAHTPRGCGAVGGPEVGPRTIYARVGRMQQVTLNAVRTGMDIFTPTEPTCW